jgi:hypothetical protein
MPVWPETYYEDRWIGTYSIGLTIQGKLGCPNMKEERKSYYENGP